MMLPLLSIYFGLFVLDSWPKVFRGLNDLVFSLCFLLVLFSSSSIHIHSYPFIINVPDQKIVAAVCLLNVYELLFGSYDKMDKCSFFFTVPMNLVNLHL